MLNNLLTHASGTPAASNKLSFLQINHPHIMVDSVKKSEDDDHIIVRIHEFAGSRGPVQMQSDLPISGWQECDLMERPINEKRNSSIIEFQIHPYEIKTFLIEVN